MIRKIALALAMTVTFPSVGSATQLVLNPANVIGSSAAYDSRFLAGNIFDNQTGVVSEPTQTGYWLNPDNAQSAAFIKIDLGQAYQLSNLEFFNTHNSGYDDRGTGAFSVLASNNVGFSDAVTLLTGTLSAAGNPAPNAASGNFFNDLNSGAPITGQNFAASGTYRYLEFLPTTVSTSAPSCCGPTNFGLNELRVSAVPEPATWAMLLLGFGMIGFAMRKRSNVRTTVSHA